MSLSDRCCPRVLFWLFRGRIALLRIMAMVLLVILLTLLPTI